MDGKKSPTTPPLMDDLSTPPGFPTPMAHPPGFPTPVASRPAVSAPVTSPPGFPTPVASMAAFSSPGERRGRGRPRGSANRARPSASAGAPPAAASVPLAAVPAVPASDASLGKDFLPHTMIIPPGEDLSMRISYFAEEMNPRAVCVISAIGMISSSILSNSGSPNGVFRNDAEYDIQTLSGSYTYSSNQRYGNLKAVLTRPDGEVIAGTVSGPLIAATPVMVVLGSFRQGGTDQDEIRHGTESYPMTDDSFPFGPPQASVY